VRVYYQTTGFAQDVVKRPEHDNSRLNIGYRASSSLRAQPGRNMSNV
jgi:hypothetical protein